MARISRSEPPRPARSAGTQSTRRPLALAIFALMALVAPLLFGAVDRLPQIALVVLLLAGVLVQPPAVVPLSRWGNRLAIAFLALVLFKEFAPATWFGAAEWRSMLTRDFALEMPSTHHPEPGRAIEALLAGAVGLIWFLWVRRLAADRENRPLLAWILLSAAAVVGLVAFATHDPGSDAIYSQYLPRAWSRYTPGWSGFGPFPNRNHSANFFAMAALLGCGCLAWAWLRKKWLLVGLGMALVGVNVVAILVSESRGGLLSLAIGLAVFVALCLLKVRNRRALGVAVGAVLVFGALALAFGSQVMARFQSRETSEMSTLSRLQIWQDTIGMWKDAPLLGHGLGSFASIFPLYQKTEFENQFVIHPESSWLQWLAELGAVPLLLAAVAAFLFLGGHLRESFSRRRSFFLGAGGFAAVAALLFHALIDVPAHRWGTAGFALAAVAIACPMRLSSRRVREPRQVAFVLLGVAAIWLLPFFADVPRWSPTAQVRLISRQAEPPGVSMAELDQSLRWFPLSPELHQLAGFRLLRTHGRAAPAMWQRHFAIAARLVPGSWYLTEAQARAVQRLSPIMAVPYWQHTVARSGIHLDEVFARAVQETRASPVAQAAWGRYAEAHPHLLLAYVRVLPDSQRGYYYSRWWKQRAGAADLTPAEIRDFYALAGKWGNAQQLRDWMTQNAAWEARDFREWATLLHNWRDDAGAWQLLARHTVEPSFPSAASTVPRPQLEATWQAAPQNLVNAQDLARARDAEGDSSGRDEILLAVAASERAPRWFVEKAAHALARQGHVREAVDLLLRAR